MSAETLRYDSADYLVTDEAVAESIPVLLT